MKLAARKFIRAWLLTAGLAVLCLVAACGPLSGILQPDPTATSAPASALPTSAPAASPASTKATSAMPSTAVTTSAAQPTAASSNAQTVRLEIVTGDTEARYRVREQLARLSFPSDAIGATKAVTGTIVARADGTIDTAQSKFQVDLSTLKSDEGQRDNFIKQNVLQTNRFKYATFVPTAIQGLALPPKDGPVSFKLIGDLTIRDVTKQVAWDVTGNVGGSDAKGTATTSFTFAYFNLNKPNVFTVLSLEDTIKLELDVHLRVAAQ